MPIAPSTAGHAAAPACARPRCLVLRLGPGPGLGIVLRWQPDDPLDVTVAEIEHGETTLERLHEKRTRRQSTGVVRRAMRVCELEKTRLGEGRECIYDMISMIPLTM